MSVFFILILDDYFAISISPHNMMVAKDDSVVISIYVTGLTATTTLITGGE